jgi:hypothetical protein
MSEQEELKQAVEQLSEHEFKRLRILKKVSKLVDDADLSEINTLPELYKIQIKKALEELGSNRKASQIET